MAPSCVRDLDLSWKIRTAETQVLSRHRLTHNQVGDWITRLPEIWRRDTTTLPFLLKGVTFSKAWWNGIHVSFRGCMWFKSGWVVYQVTMIWGTSLLHACRCVETDHHFQCRTSQTGSSNHVKTIKWLVTGYFIYNPRCLLQMGWLFT